MVAYGPSPDFDVPSLTVARPVAVARRTVPWLVGPVVLLLRGRSLELVDPSACPGLLELTAIGVLRSRPDLPVGALFDALQFIVMAAALAAFVALGDRRTHSFAIAIATALAAGLGPLFPSALAPPWEAAGFGIASAAALLIVSNVDPPGVSRSALRVLAIVATCAALLLIPLWLLAGPLSTNTPGVCVIPPGSIARAVEIVTRSESWMGPFVLGLAALGAFTEAQRADRRTTLLVAAALTAMFVAASATALSAPVAAAPLVV